MPIGKPTLDFSTVLRSDVRDVLSTKLSVFYYKEIAHQFCRLTLYAPESCDIDPGRCFSSNETSLIRFDLADSNFWFYAFLVKFINFCIAAEKEPSTLVDTGKIVLDIEQLRASGADICVPALISDQRLIRHVNEQLPACGIQRLPEEELIHYDFSAVFLSSRAAEFYKRTIHPLIGKYPDYISSETGYALLSCLTAQARKMGFMVDCLNLKVVDARDEERISTFYAV
jgi:hypothetical protein